MYGGVHRVLWKKREVYRVVRRILRVFIRISLSLLFVVGSVSRGVGGVFVLCVDDEKSPTNGSGQASAYGVYEQNILQDLASGIRLGS